ncbi:MAG: cytochrome d ubiquinol oxidase subunit II [Armatimonadota bacterium]|jgi:cytochrome d ubiquinol oxidase subunit II
MSPLQTIWFFIIGLLFTAYAILDGFDLGVGFWYPFSGRDRHRRTMLRAIGPVWDGNEVWLVAAGGALFAAFPPVYAAAFSGMYLALMLVLLGLILRAVAIEFRGHDPSPRWRRAWDRAFAVGSILPALLFGVAVGNIVRGLPMDDAGNFAGSFIGLLNPYALVVGLLSLAMFATHGALYVAVKTEGYLAARARRWAQTAWVGYVLLFVVVTAATLATQSRARENFDLAPRLWILPVGALAAIVMIGLLNRGGRERKAFALSSVSIVALMALWGAAIFPDLVPALGRPDRSLSAMNASSSELTLKTMLILAALAMPFVIAYTTWVYRTFGGKVRLDDEAY